MVDFVIYWLGVGQIQLKFFNLKIFIISVKLLFKIRNYVTKKKVPRFKALLYLAISSHTVLTKVKLISQYQTQLLLFLSQEDTLFYITTFCSMTRMHQSRPIALLCLPEKKMRNRPIALVLVWSSFSQH